MVRKPDLGGGGPWKNPNVGAKKGGGRKICDAGEGLIVSKNCTQGEK